VYVRESALCAMLRCSRPCVRVWCYLDVRAYIGLPTALLAVPGYFENRGVFSTTVDGATGRNIIALSGTHSPVRVQITPDSEIIGGAVYVANATSTHCRRCSDK